MLHVKGKELDVDGTRALENGRRLPVHGAVVVDDRARHQRDLVLAVSTVVVFFIILSKILHIFVLKSSLYVARAKQTC